jgi:FPC/CPF motif-containing protein YcgG
MVFNVHAQFERLREERLFERMQETIRSRDLKLQGSLNPNLSDFGKQSEAKQYSGRPVEKEWKCPFQRFFGKWTGNPHE